MPNQLNRLQQYISKASFTHSADKNAALELAAGLGGTPSGRAEELTTQLEAEIVNRDARIAELEATKLHGEMVMLRTDRDRLAAELKYTIAAYVTGNKPSGVVLPEPLKRGDEGGSGEYGAAMIRGFNACLREVARLNPCRAQAVPAMARALADRCADACNVNRDDYWKQYGDDCIEDVRAMLAAAPSAQQPVKTCGCTKLCEQRYLASDEVGADCKAVHGQKED